MNELDPLFEENEMLKKVVLEQSARINEMRAALQSLARIVQFKVNAALAPEQDK